MSDYNNYLIFGRVGSGYSQQQLEEFREKVGCHAMVIDPSNPPDHLKKHWKALSSSNRPDVWFPPDKSAVLQLMCGEVIQSSELEVGYTMRFPRLEHFRYDKAPHEIMTVEDVREAFLSPKQRQSTGGEDEGGEQPAAKKRAKRHFGESKKRVKGADSQFSLPKNLGAVQPDADWFENMVFCLLSNQRFEYFDRGGEGEGGGGEEHAAVHGVEYTMEQLQHMVLLKGGSVEASPPPPTATRQPDVERYILVAPENGAGGYCMPLSVRQYLESGRYDMIDFSYVVDCMKANRKIAMRGSYFYTASYRAMSSNGPFFSQSDIWGLPSAEPVTAADVRRSLKCTFDSRLRVLEKHAKPPVAKRPVTTAKAKAKQAGEASPLLPYDPERVRAILAEKDRLQNRGWRDVAAQLADNEVRLLGGPFNSCFSNRCVLYVDLFADLGPMVSTAGFDEVTREHLRCCDYLPLRLLACRLQLHGAALSRSLHAGVTHIVVCEADLTRVPVLRARLRELRLLPENVFEKRMCSDAWAEAIIAGGFRGPHDFEEVTAREIA